MAAADLYTQSIAKVSHLLDRQLSPLGLKTLDALDPNLGDTVLDIGCGTGQTLPQIADRLGGPEAGGRVIGVDISAGVLALAKQRCAQDPRIELIHADVQTLDLPSASVDGVFSRIGLMAISDPVEAFDNLHRILKARGRLAFCCWRSLEENELDLFPLLATGQNADVQMTPFRFADPDFIREVLTASGFKNLSIEAHDIPVSCGTLDETCEVLLSVGGLGQIVRNTPALRAEVEPKLRRALLERSDPENISLSAAIWVVSAQAS